MDIIFIVNGVDVVIKSKKLACLKFARNKALSDTNNTGRPMEEWEVHNDRGERLDTNKTIKTLGMQDGARVFLNLKTGAGG